MPKVNLEPNTGGFCILRSGKRIEYYCHARAGKNIWVFLTRGYGEYGGACGDVLLFTPDGLRVNEYGEPCKFDNDCIVALDGSRPKRSWFWRFLLLDFEFFDGKPGAYEYEREMERRRIDRIVKDAIAEGG